MTTIGHDDAGLILRFPGWERTMTGRSALHVPVDAIRTARAAPGWTSEVLGIRSGLVVSGVCKLGVFTHPSGRRRLVSMRRGRPLLRIETDRAATGFDELLISTPDAAELARSLQAVAR